MDRAEGAVLEGFRKEGTCRNNLEKQKFSTWKGSSDILDGGNMVCLGGLLAKKVGFMLRRGEWQEISQER